jgi:hypothetical protein
MIRRWLSFALAVLSFAACSHKTQAPPPPVTDPAALVAPPQGQGFQFGTGAFDVPAGTEEQDCYFFNIGQLATAAGLPGDQPVHLHRVQLVQKAGSHHMNLFRVRSIPPAQGHNLGPAGGAVQKGTNGQGECFKSPNWSDWPLIANTQQEGDLDWTYPDGVANSFNPDEWIMLQTHYVNASDQQTPQGGQVAVNFWTIPTEQVTDEMGTLFATLQSIRICQHNPTPTFESNCSIKNSDTVHIIGANGHFHGRGTKFDIYKMDGPSSSTPPDADRFYESTQWADPPMLHSPDLSVDVAPSGGIWWSCSYQWTQPDPAAGGCDALNAWDKAKHGTPDNQLDCCYTFGPIVETNEHCNAFVYYYPKRDDIFCN